MQGDGKQNENSLFAGIMPGREAPRPAPPPPPPPQETLGAVKKLLGEFERSVLEHLDRKLAAAAAPAAPEAPPVRAPAPWPAAGPLLKKMEELEGRLAAWQERSVFSAAQLKAAEEARIGGRREIEDLLKAVREQQKFSELDRQMHEQLQKSWTRAEELEKRLLELYAASARPPEKGPAPPPLDAEALKESVVSAVFDRLEHRLAGLEERLRGLPAAAEAARALEERRGREFISELRGELERGFAAGAAGLRIAADGVSENVRESTAGALREEARLGAEHLETVLARLREREDALAISISERLDSFVLKSGEQSAAISALSASSAAGRAAAEKELAELRAAAAAGAERLRAEIAAELAANSARVGEEARRALAEAALRLEKAGAAAAALARAGAGLEAIGGALAASVAELDKFNLESLLGVSGVLLRRNIRALRDALEKLGPERDSLAAAERALAGAARRLDGEG